MTIIVFTLFAATLVSVGYDLRWAQRLFAWLKGEDLKKKGNTP